MVLHMRQFGPVLGSNPPPFILCTSSHGYTMAQTSNPKGRNLIAVIGDEVCVEKYD
jgi:hypothetical protein